MRTLVKGIPRDGNMKFRVVKPRIGRHRRRRAKTDGNRERERRENEAREEEREGKLRVRYMDHARRK